MRFRGDYADADGDGDGDGDGDVWPLCRLRYTGTTDRWGVAIHLASRDGYEARPGESGRCGQAELSMLTYWAARVREQH